jgi:hypothetical protein
VGVKGFLRGRRKSTEKAEADPLSPKPIQEANEEMDAELNVEFSEDELQEFLEGDRLEVSADPAFKERLRRKLWEIVRGRMRDDPESEGI